MTTTSDWTDRVEDCAVCDERYYGVDIPTHMRQRDDGDWQCIDCRSQPRQSSGHKTQGD